RGVVEALVPSARNLAQRNRVEPCNSGAWHKRLYNEKSRRLTQTPLQLADFSPENINDVLHFADTQKKCRTEKSGAGNRNRHEQYRQFLQEPHVRPRI